MSRFGRLGTLLALAATLAGCGDGGGGSSSTIGSNSGGSGGGTATGTVDSSCSLRNRQNWVSAQMNEWYLFPDTLPASLDPTPYTTVSDYIDALTATARAQRKDRYFTYITSIKEENAYYSSGASAGFGFRLTADSTQSKLMIAESFESGAALAAGIDRGTTILGIGTTASNIQSIQDIVRADPNNGLSNALGPDTAGTTRFFNVADPSGATRTVSLTKSAYTLQPVSPNYGTQIITDNGRRYGYVNLRTFISTADPQLRAAFASFKQQGITQVIVDLRYNGGGSIDIADLFNNLLGGNRQTSDVMGYVAFRPSKSSNDETTYFAPQPESIVPTRLAFIGTGGTASASELVLNRTLPYMGSNTGLIGANTYGKPVGQIARDNAQCDDRLRVIALSIQNANRQGDYYNGLAGVVPASCRASDDLTRKMGDPQEASTRAALDFLQGKSCTPISATASAQAAGDGPRKLLQPERPSVAQRDVPGLF
ncbi:S41 family peptidase [Sphingomonas yabuuchiae]|uniref:C-terminal processing protease CtpA/Prc n=1 Tax=Sphingomonas yabuuchiae TaxID=172044 RepID=A0AA41A2K9_9SPHN|nr:S41 family peptidase [Sphingomonas yabuuchiae]MBB4610257.1 C-terminal processing protease CtpA/Prc [Sphingomonas yabuuchiae]MBN3560449.1 peptidase S41 [Sphingomonas yabuuchiae]